MTTTVFAQPHALSRAGGVTAHSQIERWFLDTIAAGALVPGDRLPREQDLAGFFGVSRMTLRQALADLEQRGVVDRVPGRAGGTFVTEPKIDCDLTGLAGFTEQLRRANLHAQAEVLSAATVAASPRVADALGLERAAAVHEIVRIRLTEDRPLALEHSWFPAAELPGMLAHELTGSLYSLLAERYARGPRTATESLEAVIPSAEQAARLDLGLGRPAMRIERTAFTAAGLAVEYAHDLFRSDRVRISVRSGV
ncbi:GntR family transcriptional regulator [Jatrophihabitans telluris]|uniref:GntR family transcriptional regulator n=1 Tax=Jatrophihabitans telluris TaxID=2038343 RepID=A0ABY4R2P7_9ACTN|nr:GntR family transcriptional regulator [Jatrophihabitans telluris]UQX89607.1 GntR family transcriptional regulator [Jatrophihabitans telluris]